MGPMKTDFVPRDGSPELLRQLRRGATRTLFATSVLFVPVPFFMLFVVGLVPLASIGVFFIAGLVDDLERGGEGIMLTVAILISHVVVDAFLLYVLSALVCGVLFGLLPTRVAVLAVGLLVAGELVAAFFPIYTLAGEHNRERLDFWRIWLDTWRVWHPGIWR